MLRATYGVAPAKAIDVELRVPRDATRAIVERHAAAIARMAKITAKITTSGGRVPRAAKAIVGADLEIIMPLGDLIDAPTEAARIAKDIAKGEKEIAGIEKKLANPDFLSRAPEEVVAELRQRRADEETRLARLTDAKNTLEGE